MLHLFATNAGMILVHLTFYAQLYNIIFTSMDPKKRRNLDDRRHHLQLKLKVEEKARLLLFALEDHLVRLQQLAIPYEVVYLVRATEAEKPYWQQALSGEPWLSLGLQEGHLLESDSYPVQAKTVARFGSTHPLRYVPNLPVKASCEEDAALMVRKAVEDLGFTGNEPLYFFFPRFPLVLQMDLEVAVQWADALFDIPQSEDVVLVSRDYRWMIFRSLEHEWRYGYAQQTP